MKIIICQVGTDCTKMRYILWILCCRWPKEEERSCHFLFGSTIFLLKTLVKEKTLVKDGCFDKSGFSKIDFCCINAILLTAHAATPLWSFFCYTCTVLCRFTIVYYMVVRPMYKVFRSKYRYSSFNAVLLYCGIPSTAVFSRPKTPLNFHLTRFIKKKI